MDIGIRGEGLEHAGGKCRVVRRPGLKPMSTQVVSMSEIDYTSGVVRVLCCYTTVLLCYSYPFERCRSATECETSPKTI